MSESFLTFDLMDDEEAYSKAISVLDQHRSAFQVVVWCGDRKVATRKQMDPDLLALLTQPRPSGEGAGT